MCTHLRFPAGPRSTLNNMSRLDDHDYADECFETIRADPRVIYDIVSDLPRMGRLSTENRGGRWLPGKPAASQGARFLGFNRRGPIMWFTIAHVDTAEPGKQFSFRVPMSGATWSFHLQAEGDSTVVRQTREPFRKRPGVARLFAGIALGGVKVHDDEMRIGMASTLASLKALAEEAGSSSS